MGLVEFERKGQTVVLKLNRPEKLNALNEQMRLELIDKLKKANSDEKARCIVLTGEGKGFCVGADLDSVREDLGSDLMDTFHPLLDEIRFGPKIVISAVNGVTAGAGMSIALSADIRYCSRSARFITAFHKIGLAPDTGLSFLLPRLMPAGKAMELLLSGGELDSEEASAMGLFRSVDDPMVEAMNKASELSGGPYLSYLQSKRLINKSIFGELRSFLALEAEVQRNLGRSSDFEEGKKAFGEKRRPLFRGR